VGESEKLMLGESPEKLMGESPERYGTRIRNRNIDPASPLAAELRDHNPRGHFYFSEKTNTAEDCAVHNIAHSK